MDYNASRSVPTEIVTAGQFKGAVGPQQKADLIGGTIYMSPPESQRHSDIRAFLSHILKGYANRHDSGRVFEPCALAFELSEYAVCKPDIALVCKNRLHHIKDGWMRAAPDLVVEVASHESRERDYFYKKQLYERVGIKEYWLIDYVQGRNEFYELRRRRFRLVRLDKNLIFRSRVVPGLWIDVEWLIDMPLPFAQDKLLEVFAGPEPGMSDIVD